MSADRIAAAFVDNCSGTCPPGPSMSDNLFLSDVGLTLQSGAVPADPLVAEYCQASRAANTRRAYAADLVEFERWGGRLPSTPEQVAKYLAHSATSLRPSTLRRRLAALASAHHDAGMPDPTKARIVLQVMHGIERRHGTHPKQVEPLLLDDLARIVALMGSSLPNLRDRALLLLGFFGALRRSEIVALNFDDVRFRQGGLDLVIRKSKTDQLRASRRVHLLYPTAALDPGLALKAWLVQSGIREGPIFRDASLLTRLSDRAAARIVKKWVSAVGLPAKTFSGHSLRAGFATSAALAGVNATIIAQQTGHRSQQTVAAYVRLAANIRDNP